MKKNILVTGGTGFLGSALSIRLVDLGHNVTVFDNNSRGSVSKIESILDKINYIEGDIRNIDDVKNAIGNCDTIFHLSFVNGTKFFYGELAAVYRKGQGAYLSSGSRNVPMAAWAMGRVNSYMRGDKARTADAAIYSRYNKRR